MSPSGTFRPYIGLVGGRTLIQQPVEGLKDVDHQARAELLAAVHRRRVVFHVTVRGREDRRRPSCFGICWRPSRPGGEWWPAATATPSSWKALARGSGRIVGTGLLRTHFQET